VEGEKTSRARVRVANFFGCFSRARTTRATRTLRNRQVSSTPRHPPSLSDPSNRMESNRSMYKRMWPCVTGSHVLEAEQAACAPSSSDLRPSARKTSAQKCMNRGIEGRSAVHSIDSTTITASLRAGGSMHASCRQVHSMNVSARKQMYRVTEMFSRGHAAPCVLTGPHYPQAQCFYTTAVAATCFL
jgi:hypothetical protein